MKKSVPPKIKKFPAAKQRRMDELLDKNSDGTISRGEKEKLKQLVDEAQKLMIANSKLAAVFAANEAPQSRSGATPVTVWVTTQPAGR